MSNILILGATSAIAAEAARIYAARGDRLLLVGRDPEKLAALQHSHPAAEIIKADLNDLNDAASLVKECVSRFRPVDTVLIAHGYLGDQLQSENEWGEAELILRTNFLSAVALLIPLAQHLESIGHGRIGVITSVAGERGRPRNYTYGAAKGALSLYLEGLRTRLQPKRITVTTLKLGPVDTPMTRDHKKHALFGKPAAIAAGIVKAIDKGEATAFVPWFWRPIMAGVRATPEAVFQKLPFLSGR
ncbi:MAG: SDR family NAD(P)-dependent oxidoreductase [Deltaproteobacteria bacterium]|nr:SDR family NAD(P)-dependent oxidoreductase [Deltaproteobacteria bacterium]